jgi:hypothetical protein
LSSIECFKEFHKMGARFFLLLAWRKSVFTRNVKLQHEKSILLFKQDYKDKILSYLFIFIY